MGFMEYPELGWQRAQKKSSLKPDFGRWMGGIVKNIYINSRLHPLLLAAHPWRRAADWIFSQEEPWLLLTPMRLGKLADSLGRRDSRLVRLFGLVRRHAPHPELYCRRLGVKEVIQPHPDAYPVVLCPRCDGVHAPHPEDVGCVCGRCRQEEWLLERKRPGGGLLHDRARDRAARRFLMQKDPDSFENGALSPNSQYNRHRHLIRDWDRAANRILHGVPYKVVAKEFDCSVGLLHRKVMERKHWEDN